MSALLAALIAATVTATAADASRSTYLLGKEAYDRGDLDTACALFAKAYAGSRRPIAVLALAQCERRAGRSADAVRHFEEFVALAPGDAHAAEAQEIIAMLRASLPPPAPEPAPELVASPLLTFAPRVAFPPATPQDDDPAITPLWLAVIGSVAAVAGASVLIALAARSTEPDGGTTMTVFGR